MVQYVKGAIVFVLSFLVFSSVAQAAITVDNLTDVQKENLELVYKVGSEIGHPELLQAIALQETSAGASVLFDKKLPVSRRSYGIMQIQVDTARVIFRDYPEVFEMYFPGRTPSSLNTKELMTFLLVNKEANIRIAAYLFRLYMTMSNTPELALAGYNMGIFRALKLPKKDIRTNKYQIAVRQLLAKVVIPFNVAQQVPVDLPQKESYNDRIVDDNNKNNEEYNYERTANCECH